MLLIPVVDRLVYPLLGRLGCGLSMLTKIGVGFAFAMSSVIVAGISSSRGRSSPPHPRPHCSPSQFALTVRPHPHPHPRPHPHAHPRPHPHPHPGRRAGRGLLPNTTGRGGRHFEETGRPCHVERFRLLWRDGTAYQRAAHGDGTASQASRVQGGWRAQGSGLATEATVGGGCTAVAGEKSECRMLRAQP